MSTKEEYLQLWKKFESLLEKRNLSLEDFAKQWENKYPDDEKADYRKFIKKLKAKRERRYKVTRINANTLSDMQEYINFLTPNRILLELKDISYDTWFD